MPADQPAADKAPVDTAANRREFLKTGSAMLAAGGLLAGSRVAAGAYAGSDNILKVGLIGCGGRGSGAAVQALNADPQTRLYAMADAFEDRLEASLKNLSNNPIAKQIDVGDRKFVGFDAYKDVIQACDVVLLTTPPHFRPQQLRAAIEAGKHVFAEKPVAVDAAGVKSVLESARMAKEKNLSLVSGLCWRYHYGMRETFDRVHDGTIGRIVALQCSYDTRGLWMHPRKPDWSDMEWQMRNWLYFTWLSGDFNTEQHVHSLDKMAWAMGDEYPVKCSGTGGRQVRTGEQYGHVYDHFAVTYEYANGVKLFARCRQQDGTSVDVSDHVMGSKGTIDVFKHSARDENGNMTWKFDGKNNNMYQTEHDEMFAAIRKGDPLNNGIYMAKSTMMAVMGRMSAYTGKTITWDQAMASEEVLGPDKYEWGDLPMPPVALPGVTPFV